MTWNSMLNVGIKGEEDRDEYEIVEEGFLDWLQGAWRAFVAGVKRAWNALRTIFTFVTSVINLSRSKEKQGLTEGIIEDAATCVVNELDQEDPSVEGIGQRLFDKTAPRIFLSFFDFFMNSNKKESTPETKDAEKNSSFFPSFF